MNDVHCAVCDIRFPHQRRPALHPPLPVSINRTVPDLATSDNKRKQLQERKLNIPADAFDWSVRACMYVCVHL